MASTIGSERGAGAPTSQVDGLAEDAGYGWVIFAGTMLAIVGTLNFVYGIAAISNSKFYVRDATYVISDLNTWGWVLLAIGCVQLVSAVGIWMKTPGARWVGIVTASLNAIVQMFLIPANPWLAVSLFAIDILVIYGLVAHGRRTAF